MSGTTFLPTSLSKETLFKQKISQLVTRLVHREDQDERETDGAVHRNSAVPKLRKTFQKFKGRKFSDTDGLQHIYEGSNQMRFQYCMNSKKKTLLLIRAIQGHTGGNLIAPELMGHCAVPKKKNGKNSCFIKDVRLMSLQSSNHDSSLNDEKAKKEDRPSGSHLSTHSGKIQAKKNLAMTSQAEKNTLRQ